MSLIPIMGRRPPNVIETIAEGDHMVGGNEFNYFHNGVTALGNIRVALAMAGVEHVSAVLDFPCGYGRVLRMLKAEYPDARIVAADVDRRAVDFCRATFDVDGAYTTADPRDAELTAGFDLIWCGSLLTHLPARSWPVFLEFFATQLAAGGVVVFTTHGRRIGEFLQAMTADPDEPSEREPPYNLLRDEILGLLAGVEQAGFAYVGYLNHEEYGFSVSRPDWVVERILEQPSLELVLLTEHGWAGQQDIVACAKAAS